MCVREREREKDPACQRVKTTGKPAFLFFTKEVQPSVDRIAVFRQVVWIKLVKGLVAPDLVRPFAVVVVGDLFVGPLNGHGAKWGVCVDE
jgi:hypothetical protein